MTVHRRVHDFPLTMLCNKAEPKVNVVQRSDMAQDLAKRAAGEAAAKSVEFKESILRCEEAGAHGQASPPCHVGG